MIWGHKWKKSTVTAHRDNKAVVCILNSRYSRDDYLMHMLRILFFTEAHCQFELSASHILGISNILADYLSKNQLIEFHTNLPHADTHPSHFSFIVATGPSIRLDITLLDQEVQFLCEQGIAASTQKTYSQLCEDSHNFAHYIMY